MIFIATTSSFKNCDNGSSSPCGGWTKSRCSSTPASTSKTTIVKPPVHINDNEDSAILSLDVPGFDQNNLSIELNYGLGGGNTTSNGGVLYVSGTRTNRLNSTFEFHRRFALNKVKANLEAITSNLSDDGVLEIIVPKLKVEPAKKTRMIKITTSQSTSTTTEVSDEKNNSNESNVVESPLVSAAKVDIDNNEEGEENELIVDEPHKEEKEPDAIKETIQPTKETDSDSDVPNKVNDKTLVQESEEELKDDWEDVVDKN